MQFNPRSNYSELASKIIKAIKSIDCGKVKIMEVCGTHTMAIFRFGIRNLLPENIKLISGPGCPVCVTPTSIIDTAIEMVQKRLGIMAIFGDILRVPGSESSLEREKANKGDVQVVYSVLDALELARNTPKKPVIFFAVGFETTAPSIACAIETALKERMKNFFILSANKLIPPAMEALLNSPDLDIDGFICPGHVSTIIGSSPYEFIAEKYRIPCVITGFEPLDILQGIYLILRQIAANRPRVEIQYSRVVKKEGNLLALKKMEEVFQPQDTEWRGLGVIPKSGLVLRNEYRNFDALEHFSIPVKPSKDNQLCICGDILRGIATPLQCPLFKKFCDPTHPIGACMVSMEGTCAAYYKYSS